MDKIRGHLSNERQECRSGTRDVRAGSGMQFFLTGMLALACCVWTPKTRAQATDWTGSAAKSISAKSAPDAFTFASQSNREFDVWATSGAQIVSGLDGPAAIAVSGHPTAQYRIDAGAWIRTAGTISNGQSVRLRVRTAAVGSTARQATVTIGDFSTSFVARTYATLAKTSVTVDDFVSGGRTRSFIVDRPAAGGTTGLALIVALHGDSSSAAAIRTSTNFAKLYSANNRFVVIYPQALPINGVAQFNKYVDGQRGYSALANGDYDANAADDVLFISDLIDYAARVYGIERQKVYLTGFSGGGFMAYHYAIAAPRRVAGAAPVAASLYGDFADNYLPDYFASRFIRTPIFHVHGLGDAVVPPPSAPENNGDGNVEYPLGNFGYASCNDTTPTSKSDGKARTKTYCTGVNAVQWVGIQGLDHAWPTQAKGYDATSNIWRFFKARTRACTDVPLRVSGRDLLDACNQPIQLRGVNYAAYKSGYDPNENLMPEIAATGANAVRIVWWIDNPDPSTDPSFSADQLDAAITAAYQAGMVPVLDIQDLTCNRRPLSDVNNLVVPWATTTPFKQILLKHQDYLVFNLANEAGFVRFGGSGTAASRLTAFRDVYRTAVTSLRNAGLTMPLMIDAPDCGQSLPELMSVAPEITAADPRAGILYSAHAYWSGYAPDAASAGAKLREAVATTEDPPQPRGLPVVLGEVAARQDSSGSVTCDLVLPYADYMAEALRYNVGWMIWAWHEDCNARRMVNAPFTFQALTGFGLDVTNNPTYGLMESVPVDLPSVP
ncbi:MAG: cellulase family glycosylhydrolase [Sinimarinibacterium sp.]